MLSAIFLFLICGVKSLPGLWPLPHKLSLGDDSQVIDPCSMAYQFEPAASTQVLSIVQFYSQAAFKCKVKQASELRQNTERAWKIMIQVSNQTVIPPFKGFQNYTLEVSDSLVSIKADYYPGLLRAYETFTQLLVPGSIASEKPYILKCLPIKVQDWPEFEWRGLMIDTARHFLSVQDIKRTIDSLMYSKMNVLHWHITDEDSFPVIIDSHPEMASYGALKQGQVYNKLQLTEVIQYALSRGVRVVPEVDTPAHTRAWGNSPQLRNLTMVCKEAFQGQFDLSVEQTYKVLEDVLRELNQVFIDPVFHLGGDEISEQCWDKRPAIRKYMTQSNISSYHELSVHFRKRQKQIWRTFSNKSVMYWGNQVGSLPTQDEDFLQWWGFSYNIGEISKRNSKVVLSSNDQVYLDIGYGGRTGKGYRSSIITWKTVYTYNPVLEIIRDKVMGGEACMWNENSNINTHFQKIWPRTAIVSERLWNPYVNTTSELQMVSRLISHSARLKARGIPHSPVTVQLCEINPQICFD